MQALENIGWNELQAKIIVMYSRWLLITIVCGQRIKQEMRSSLDELQHLSSSTFSTNDTGLVFSVIVQEI